MSAWDAYPEDYRQGEVRAILSAIRAGECVSVVGLSGAGKSNLIGFLHQRKNTGSPALWLVDCNRVRDGSRVTGLFRLIAQVLGSDPPDEGKDPLAGMERAAAEQLAKYPQGVCLLFDRYDMLTRDEQASAAGPLRVLRDAFKYQLTYVIAARRALDANNELAELFYANTLWLGPLQASDARWSVQQYAQRRGQTWDEGVFEALIRFSWGYPALLRAGCEAYASAAGEDRVLLDIEALRAHPAVQRRVQEFWSDQPTPDDLRRSGLMGHPLLGGVLPVVSAGSPDLTASENRLLTYLQTNSGSVCEKDDLIRAVWTEDRVSDGLRDDSLAQLIRRLRQKVGTERIQTIPGRGYRYSPG